MTELVLHTNVVPQAQGLEISGLVSISVELLCVQVKDSQIFSLKDK